MTTGTSCLPAVRRIAYILSAISLLAWALPGIGPAWAEDDCDAYYFGIAGDSDFGRALKCYQAQNRWDMIILMHLNGEAVPASPQKAAELFKALEKTSPEEAKSLEAEALKKAIDDRLQNPGRKFPRIQYCSDIASTTYAISSCASLEQRLDDKQIGSAIAEAKTKLKPAEAALLDTILAEFKTFRVAERDRMYQQFIDGSIRNIAAIAQASLVRDQFLKIIKETIEQRGLKPSDEQAFKAADAELNLVYRQDIQEYSKTYEDMAKNEASVETKNMYTHYINDYKKAAKKAQLHWIKYRDLLTDLARSLYGTKTATFDPGLSMQTLLTKTRVLELKNNPVGEG